MIRRILYSLAGISGLLLALNQIGVTPVVPGYDTGFGWDYVVEGGVEALRFRTDAGDLTVFVDLWVHGVADSAEEWRARLSLRKTLSVRAQAMGGGRWRLRIAGPDSASLSQKFVWPGGVDLLLSKTGSGHLRVEDWWVYPKEKRPDSKGRAAWRRAWFWISATFLLIAALGLGVERWASKPTPPGMHQQTIIIVRRAIASVEGKDRHETKRMQKLLTKMLLESATADEAIEAVMPARSSFSQRRQLFFTARRRFLRRLEMLRGLLLDYRRLLEESKLTQPTGGQGPAPS